MRNNLLEKRMIQLSCHMESHTLSWEEEFDWWKVNPGVRALECVEERPRTTGIKTETPGGRILIYHIRALGVRVLQKPRMLGLFVVVVVVVVFLSFFFFLSGIGTFRPQTPYGLSGTGKV